MTSTVTEFFLLSTDFEIISQFKKIEYFIIKLLVKFLDRESLLFFDLGQIFMLARRTNWIQVKMKGG